MDNVERRVEAMLADSDHEVDPALIQEVLALPPDYPGLDRIIAMLTAAGGDQPAKPPLNPSDFYQPGQGQYTLGWPLAASTLALLPVPFEALDRKTQFFVLFQEWTSVELHATTALNAGDLGRARMLFQECLARAGQLDVPELKARSHEGIASVCLKVGDGQAAGAQYRSAIVERGIPG